MALSGSLYHCCGGECRVQIILVQYATRMPGTRERHEKERERSTSAPKTVLVNYASFWLVLKNPARASQLGRKHVVRFFL